MTPATLVRPGIAMVGVTFRLPPFFFSALVVARVSVIFFVTSLPVARLNFVTFAADFEPSLIVKETGSTAVGAAERSVTFAVLRLASTTILRTFRLSEKGVTGAATGGVTTAPE